VGYDSDAASSAASSDEQTSTAKPVEQIKLTTAEPNKKAKKLLSLAAVLPQEVFAQLSRTVAEHDNIQSDDDEDDEYSDDYERHNNSEYHKNNIKLPKIAATGNPRKLEQGGGRGGGKFSALLSDLHSTRSKGDMMKKKSTNNKAFVHNKSESPVNQTSCLTDDLTNVTFEVMKKVGSNNSKKMVNNNDETTAPNITNRTEGIASKASMSKNIASAARPPLTASVPRVVAAPRVCAAPQVVVKASPQPTDGLIQETLSSSQASNPYMQPGQEYQDNIMTLVEESEKKLSRKEIEKALRAGNLGIVEQQVGTTSLKSSIPDYDVSEAIKAVEDSKKGTIKVAPVAMYDASAGEAVSTFKVRGIHKARHQIHHLAQSAAALETQIAQQRITKSNSRADAKRKYGW